LQFLWGHPATDQRQHPRNGSISGTTTVAAVNGVATFTNLSGTVQGTYQFLAIDGALGTAASGIFTITAPAYRLQWAAGDDPSAVASDGTDPPSDTNASAEYQSLPAT